MRKVYRGETNGKEKKERKKKNRGTSCTYMYVYITKIIIMKLFFVILKKPVKNLIRYTGTALHTKTWQNRQK